MSKTEKEKVEIIKIIKFTDERLELITKDLEIGESINKLLKVAKNETMRATLKKELNNINDRIILDTEELKKLSDSIKSIKNN